jgi:hypothetical protein
LIITDSGHTSRWLRDRSCSRLFEKERAMPIRIFLKQSRVFDHEAIRVMGIAYEFARSELRLDRLNF